MQNSEKTLKNDIFIVYYTFIQFKSLYTLYVCILFRVMTPLSNAKSKTPLFELFFTLFM